MGGGYDSRNRLKSVAMNCVTSHKWLNVLELKVWLGVYDVGNIPHINQDLANRQGYTIFRNRYVVYSITP